MKPRLIALAADIASLPFPFVTPASQASWDFVCTDSTQFIGAMPDTVTCTLTISDPCVRVSLQSVKYDSFDLSIESKACGSV